MEEESEVKFTETVGVDSNIVTGAVASGEEDTAAVLLKCSLQSSYGLGVKLF